MTRFVLGARLSIAGAIAAALLSAATLGLGSVALGQDQSAAVAKDVIFARKILMGSIGDNMDELEAIIEAGKESGKIDVQHGTQHADIASVMLLAFPHLFPPHSNEWKPNVDKDPGTDTYAAPEIWTRFGDFYQLASDAAKSAFDASRARNAEEFKKSVAELRVACDGCHALYQKKD
jgi:cytochrome c556